MPSTRETHTTDLVGPSGITFDDRLVIRDINTAVITRIVVTHDTHLRSITVGSYGCNDFPRNVTNRKYFRSIIQMLSV